MEFSRQEYWNGLPFPSPGDLPNPGSELASPDLQTDSLLSELPGKPAGNASAVAKVALMVLMPPQRLHDPGGLCLNHPAEWRLLDSRRSHFSMVQPHAHLSWPGLGVPCGPSHSGPFTLMGALLTWATCRTFPSSHLTQSPAPLALPSRAHLWPSHHITGPCVYMSLLCALANPVALLTPSIPHVSTQVGPFLSHTSPEPQLRPGVWSLALREPFYLCSSGLSIMLCHHPTPCVCLTSPGLHETGTVSFLPLDP